MKNKRFLSLILAGMLALQPATHSLASEMDLIIEDEMDPIIEEESTENDEAADSIEIEGIDVFSEEAAAAAAWGFCGDTASYEADNNGTWVIKGTGAINANAFGQNSDIKNVVINEGITSIKNSAFKDCSNLCGIIIPDSVTSIEAHAFSGCSKLSSIAIPNGVTSIKECVFEDCSKLSSISIPNSVTSIEAYAFSGCSNLSNIMIPNSVKSIGNYAFWNCSNLSSITIPDSVTSIGDDAFEGCSNDLVIICSGESAAYIYAENHNIPTIHMHVAVTDPEVAATCTATGLTEGSHCSFCNAVITAQKEIPATGHTVVTDAAVAATCTTAGKTEGSHCSVCSTVITAQKEIPATGHKAGAWITTKAATNLAAGEKVQKCTVCNAVIKTRSIQRISSVTLYKGVNKSYTLTAGKWKLKKTKAATLKGNKLTIKKAGTIKVTEQKTKQTVTIKIKKPTLSLNKKKVTLKVGATFQIKASATPTAGISYKSAKSRIAKVSSSGLIKAVKKGKTTITVKANGVSKKITVTVKK